MSYACNGLQAKNCYPIATLYLFQRAAFKAKLQSLPQKIYAHPGTDLSFWRQKSQKAFIHAVFQGCNCYPIATQSFLPVFILSDAQRVDR